jgi:hypothetical protein
MTTAVRRGAPQRRTGGASQRKRSFLVGTQDVLEDGDYTQSFTTVAGGNLQPWTLQGTGWLARLWFYFNISVVGSTAASTQPDGPFNAIANIQLNDVNNEAIFGPFDGYVWFVTNKYGGYYFDDDPATNAVFTYETSTDNGFASFVLCIPLEIVSRDPLGPVASVNNTATLTVIMSISTATTLFGNTVTSWTVTVDGMQEFYWEPRKTDKQGRPISGAPPANGTTQYWTQGSIPIAGAGQINQQLITGLGYPFRSYLFLYYAATRALGETNWPATLTGLKFEANFLLTQYSVIHWQSEMSRITGYSNATSNSDALNTPKDVRGAGLIPGKEEGLYGLFFNKDFFKKAIGAETRRTYLVTSPGSNYIISGNFGAAGNLYQIVNYVAPGGGGGSASQHQDTSTITGGN